MNSLQPNLRTYVSIDELLLNAADPRSKLILEAITTGNHDGLPVRLSSMTVILKEYRGVGDIRYQMPNSTGTSGRVTKFHDANGWCKSQVPGLSTWSFFHLGFPVLGSLLRSGEDIIHFLCAEVAEGRRKDLYPLCVVNAGAGNLSSARSLSHWANAAANAGSDSYLRECVEMNRLWLEVTQDGTK